MCWDDPWLLRALEANMQMRQLVPMLLMCPLFHLAILFIFLIILCILASSYSVDNNDASQMVLKQKQVWCFSIACCNRVFWTASGATITTAGFASARSSVVCPTKFFTDYAGRRVEWPVDLWSFISLASSQFSSSFFSCSPVGLQFSNSKSVKPQSHCPLLGFATLYWKKTVTSVRSKQYYLD